MILQSRMWLFAVPMLVFAVSPVYAQRELSSVAQKERGEVRSIAALERIVTISARSLPLPEMIDLIASKAKVRIQYRDEVLAGVRGSVSVDATEQTLGTVLDKILAGTPLFAVASAEDVVTIQRVSGMMTVAATGVVTGKVTHAKTGAPITGATILVDGATSGVMTGADGTFRLSAAAGTHRVTIRAVGFVRDVRAVTVVTGETVNFNVKLEPSASVLDEVIVTGTVVATERKAIPNPITVITGEEIERRGVTRIEQLLRGYVPGVLAAEQGSEIYTARLGGMDSTKIYARGASNLNATGTPMKTFVDGVELVDASYIGSLDLQNVERIEIVVGPQAATIYGSGAMGGVMQIFTKKGMGKTAPEVTLGLRYGMLENSLSAGHTPTHDHMVAVSGGPGPAFSYTTNAFYRYSGQWQPGLFYRQTGGSLGAAHVAGKVQASGSLAVTAGKNGTNTGQPLRLKTLYTDGTFFNNQYGGGSAQVSAMQSTSSAQTMGLTVDYRISEYWQQSLTLGRSQTRYDLVPSAPDYTEPGDTVFAYNRQLAERTTFGYTTSFQGSALNIMQLRLALGADVSQSSQTRLFGIASSPTADRLANTFVTQSLRDQSRGGFGRMQIGFFDHLYLSLGLRAEHNTTYGESHKIDWTPSNGLAYTEELGELTVKVTGSYGRATRAPQAPWRLGQQEPYGSQLIETIRPNPVLTPEYSRGPQVGAEVYYGNLGSITINHYAQTVTDLIQRITVDTIPWIENGIYFFDIPVSQYLNTAAIRNRGWEATGSLNLNRFEVRGTYSWTDSRIKSVNPNQHLGAGRVGDMFYGIPSHFGSFTIGYAHAQTSVTFVTSFIGAMLKESATGPNAILLFLQPSQRIQTYIPRRRAVDGVYTVSGYIKSDIMISQRLLRAASLTANVVNLGNSYGSEGSYGYPALGRQVKIGLSLRLL